MENLLFLGVPILKHIRVVKIAEKNMAVTHVYTSVYPGHVKLQYSQLLLLTSGSVPHTDFTTVCVAFLENE